MRRPISRHKYPWRKYLRTVDVWKKNIRSTVVKRTNGSSLKEVNSGFYTRDEVSDQEKFDLIGTSKILIARKYKSEQFKDARKYELQGLMNNNTFQTVKRSTRSKDTRMYRKRFVDAFKPVDDNRN